MKFRQGACEEKAQGRENPILQIKYSEKTLVSLDLTFSLQTNRQIEIAYLCSNKVLAH